MKTQQKIKFSDKGCIEIFNQIIHDGKKKLNNHIIHYKTYWKTEVWNFALLRSLLKLAIKIFGSWICGCWFKNYKEQVI